MLTERAYLDSLTGSELKELVEGDWEEYYDFHPAQRNITLAWEHVEEDQDFAIHEYLKCYEDTTLCEAVDHKDDTLLYEKEVNSYHEYHHIETKDMFYKQCVDKIEDALRRGKW